MRVELQFANPCEIQIIANKIKNKNNTLCVFSKLLLINLLLCYRENADISIEFKKVTFYFWELKAIPDGLLHKIIKGWKNEAVHSRNGNTIDLHGTQSVYMMGCLQNLDPIYTSSGVKYSIEMLLNWKIVHMKLK
jgi:hypothetical protein